MGRQVHSVRTPTLCLSAMERTAARNCKKCHDANFDSLETEGIFLSCFFFWKVINDSYVSLMCSTGFLTGASKSF